MIKINSGKRRHVLKTASLGLAGLLLLFSLVSMAVTIITYNGQFPRFDRPDESVSAGLRYADINTEYTRELVSFRSKGNRIQGYLYGPEHEQGLVVLSHGLGGGADSYLPQILYLLDKGWRVLAYDATGSYDSEGRSTRGFPQAILDLEAALAYVNMEPEFAGLPVLLFGHSWGGYAAVNALHLDYPIAGIVSVSAANSSMDMLMEQGHRMMGGFIYTQYPYLWLYQRILFGRAVSYAAVEAINKTDVPVMIVHGSEDDVFAHDGSAIIARMDKITNPNAYAVLFDKPGRSGHNNLFRSEASLMYMDELNNEYRELYNQHNQNIPHEINQAFYATIDRFLAQEVNLELMDLIHDFLLTCIHN